MVFTAGLNSFAFFATVHPDTSGIPRSVNTTSNFVSLQNSMAFTPFSAVTISENCNWRMSYKVLSNSGSSSTIKMRKSLRWDFVSSFFSFSGCSGFCVVGSSTINVVPRPGRLCTRIFPRWALIMLYTKLKPRPVPRSPLVVKKGSKMRGKMCSGIPCPVSEMYSRHHPFSSMVERMVNVPPSGMAS